MSSSPVASAAMLVVERVRERLRAEASDAGRHPDAVRSIARAEIRRHNDFALARGLVPIDDEAAFVREVLAAVSGYGPLQPYLDDPTIEELWINAPEHVYASDNPPRRAGQEYPSGTLERRIK